MLVLIGFLAQLRRRRLRSGLGYVYKYGWSYSFGAFIGLAAAIVAVAPLAWPLIQKQMNKGERLTLDDASRPIAFLSEGSNTRFSAGIGLPMK